MPVFQIHFNLYKAHITTSRVHQNCCDQAMGMLKTGNSARTLVCPFNDYKLYSIDCNITIILKGVSRADNRVGNER